MKTIDEFYNEAMADKELAEAAGKAQMENRFTEFLIEHGVDGTAETFEAFVNEKALNRHELSDDELEQASGGTVKWEKDGKVSNLKDVDFKFEPGDQVYIKTTVYVLTGTMLRGQVISKTIRTTETPDMISYSPYYYVRVGDNSTAILIEQDKLSHI